MESNNEASPRRSVDEKTGGSRNAGSEQSTNTPQNNTEMESVVYADLGIGGRPDSMNPGDEEATDTLLYTDNDTARDAAEGLPDDESDDLPVPAEDLSDEELDREISDLADEEEAAGEPY